MKWKIYYGDGTTFSSEDGPPELAPATNIQCIIERDERHGRLVLSRFDFYIHKKDGWYGVDQFGLFDYLMEIGLLKAGRTINNELYGEIIAAASNDPDLPPKTSQSNRERRTPNKPE